MVSTTLPVMTTPRALLSQGDGSTDHVLELTDGVRYRILNPGPQFPTPAPGTPRRLIPMPFRIYGRDANERQRNQDALLLMLAAARAAASSYGVGTPVTFGVRQGAGSIWQYFDITDGEWVENGQVTEQYASGTLTLEALPEWHGTPYSIPASATLVNGAMTAFIDNVPGDRPALVQLSYVDKGSDFTNRIRAARYAAPNLRSGQHVPFYDVVSTAPGADHTDATAFGGKTSRITTTSDWQAIGTVTGATPAEANSGFFRPYLRVIDAATTPRGVTNIVISAGTESGSAPAGNYAFRIVTVDGGGNLSPASATVRTKLKATGHVTLAWTRPIGWTSSYRFRIYWQRDNGNWGYLLTSTANSPYTFTTEAGVTIADPPNDNTIVPSELRLTVSLASQVTGYPLTATPCLSSNSVAEWLEFAPVWLPPLSRQERLARQPWKVLIEGRNPHGNSNALDVDMLALLPAAQSEGAFRVKAEFPGMALATLREHLIDTDRYGLATGIVRSTSDQTEHGQLYPDGGLTLMPRGFGNQITVIAEGPAGVAEISQLSAQLAFTVTPRGRTLGSGRP